MLEAISRTRPIAVTRGCEVVGRTAAKAVFRRTQFFKIQNADWLVIFLLHTGHNQPLNYWKRPFVSE